MDRLAWNFGNYAPIPGLVYDTIGPRGTLLVASALSSVGYGTLWLAVTGRIVVGMPVLVLSCVLFGMGGGHCDAVAMVTNIRNLPTHRGLLTGVMWVLVEVREEERGDVGGGCPVDALRCLALLSGEAS